AARVRHGVPAHRAHYQNPLEAEVDAAAPLGDAFAEAHEQKRRADPDRPAQYADRHAPPAELDHGQAARARNGLTRPERASLPSTSMNAMPSKTSTVASASPSRRRSNRHRSAQPPTRTAPR